MSTPANAPYKVAQRVRPRVRIFALWGRKNGERVKIGNRTYRVVHNISKEGIAVGPMFVRDPKKERKG